MPVPHRQQVLALARRRGLLRARDLDAINVPRTTLARLMADGALERRGRGLYSLSNRDVSEHETILEAVTLVPSGVICLLSALRLHGLTTQSPHEVWIALRRNQWRPRHKYPPIRVVRMSGAALTEGVQKVRLDGTQVSAFSPAKTVVDCFRYRNKIGLDVAIEALQEARRRRLAGLTDISTIAARLRMEQVMRPYLESIA